MANRFPTAAESDGLKVESTTGARQQRIRIVEGAASDGTDDKFLVEYSADSGATWAEAFSATSKLALVGGAELGGGAGGTIEYNIVASSGYNPVNNADFVDSKVTVFYHDTTSAGNLSINTDANMTDMTGDVFSVVRTETTKDTTSKVSRQNGQIKINGAAADYDTLGIGVTTFMRIATDEWVTHYAPFEEASGGGSASIQYNSNIVMNFAITDTPQYFIRATDIDQGTDTIHLNISGDLTASGNMQLAIPKNADLAGFDKVNEIHLTASVGNGTIGSTNIYTGLACADVRPSHISVAASAGITYRRIGDNEWVATSGEVGGGGGGGAIALQQDGVEVQATASTLNFTDGLYVTSDGVVSQTLPAAFDWSVELAGDGPPATTNPSVSGPVWTGAAGAGFATVPAAGFATAMRQGTYAEFVVPARNTDICMVQLVASAPDPSTILGTPTVDYLTVQFQGGNLASMPTDGGFGLNTPVNEINYRFGIEHSSEGMFFHKDGVRTQVRAATDAVMTIQTIAGNAVSESLTFNMITNPTTPANVTAGVVNLVDAADPVHPEAFYGNVATPEMTDANVTTGTDATFSTVNAAQLKSAAETHGEISVAGKPEHFNTEVVANRRKLRFVNDDAGTGLKATVNGDTLDISVNVPSVPYGASDAQSIDSDETTPLVYTPKQLAKAAQAIFTARAGAFHVFSGGALPSAQRPSFFSNVARTSLGVVRITYASTQAVNNFMFSVQPIGTAQTYDVRVNKQDSYVEISIYTAGTTTLVDAALDITWAMRQDFNNV